MEIDSLPKFTEINSLPEYTYPRLQSPSHIRLVRLLPNLPNCHGQISLLIEEKNIQDADSTYTALSYACGDISPAVKIPVLYDRSRVMIYPTLYSALLKLRPESGDRLIWADGLCIDQGSNPEALEERGQQVRMMYMIYAKAKDVIVDLGNDLETGGDSLIKTLYDLANIPKHRWSSLATFEDDLPSLDENIEASADHKRPSEPQTLSSFLSTLPEALKQKSIWSALEELRLRPYFTRVWVIQEHALARQVSFIIGTTIIPTAVFGSGLNRIFNIRRLLNLEKNNELWEAKKINGELKFDAMDLVFKIRLLHLRQNDESSLLTSSWRSLATILHETHALDCYDNRDKVYGILGLCHAKERNDPALHVDYQESFLQFALRISRYLLSQGEKVFLYRCIGCSSSTTSASASISPLPSWTVDLTSRHADHLNSLVLNNASFDHTLYHAGGDISQTQTDKSIFEISASSESTLPHLTVSGLTIGKVQKLSPVFERKDPGFAMQDVVAEMIGWIRQLAAWVQEIAPGPATIPAMTEIFETARADTIYVLGEFKRYSQAEDTPELTESRAAFWKEMGWFVGAVPFSESEYMETAEKGLAFFTTFSIAHGRRIAKVVAAPQSGHEQHRIGKRSQHCWALVPANTELGDMVSILQGFPLPFVLRSMQVTQNALAHEVSSDFKGLVARIVGSSYVHGNGLMDGRAWEGVSRPERFVLV